MIQWSNGNGRFGDHFTVGDHFGVGIISGAVQTSVQTAKLRLFDTVCY